jgi:hypothetical protein
VASSWLKCPLVWATERNFEAISSIRRVKQVPDLKREEMERDDFGHASPPILVDGRVFPIQVPASETASHRFTGVQTQ